MYVLIKHLRKFVDATRNKISVCFNHMQKCRQAVIENYHIIFCLDRSGSMRRGGKWPSLKEAYKSFLKTIELGFFLIGAMKYAL